MKIDRDMNLVFPVELDSGTAYIHAAPISREVYKQHFFVLGKTFSAIFSEGLGTIGAQMAYLMLEKISKESGGWEGASGVKNTLINEIIRLANLVYPVDGKGWDDIPLEVAIEKGLIDPDEVLGELVFFICVCALNKPDRATALMNATCAVWGGQIISSNVTEWITSLRTSMQDDSSGGTEGTSSATSSTTQPASDSATSFRVPE